MKISRDSRLSFYQSGPEIVGGLIALIDKVALTFHALRIAPKPKIAHSHDMYLPTLAG
jgi:hypothetical protein